MCSLRVVFLLPLLCATALAQEGAFQQAPPPKVSVGLEFPEAAPSDTATDDTDAVEEDAIMEEVRSLYAKEEGGSTSSPEGDTDSGDQEGDDGGAENDLFSAIAQSVMALFGVLAIFLLLVGALKKWGKRTPLLSGHTLGTVMGRIALSPQASLHFIRVKDEVLVVGVTQQSVNLLRTMEAELFDADDGGAPDADERPTAPMDFLSQLNISQAAMEESSVGVDDELDSLKGDLQRLKQYFQDSNRARE